MKLGYQKDRRTFRTLKSGTRSPEMTMKLLPSYLKDDEEKKNFSRI